MAELQTLDPPPHSQPPPQLKDLAALVAAQAAHASAIDAVLLVFIRDRGICDPAATQIPLFSARLNVNRCRLLAAMLAPPFSATAAGAGADMSVADVLRVLALMDRGFAPLLAGLLEFGRDERAAACTAALLDGVAAAVHSTMARERIPGDWRVDELRAAMQVEVEAYWEEVEWRAERRRRDHDVGWYRVDKFLKTCVCEHVDPAVVEQWARRGGHVRDRPGH